MRPPDVDRDLMRGLPGEADDLLRVLKRRRTQKLSELMAISGITGFWFGVGFTIASIIVKGITDAMR